MYIELYHTSYFILVDFFNFCQEERYVDFRFFVLYIYLFFLNGFRVLVLLLIDEEFGYVNLYLQAAGAIGRPVWS